MPEEVVTTPQEIQPEFPAISTPAAETPKTPEPAPLYKGLSGDLKTVDEVVAYAKRMETELINEKMSKQPQPTLGGQPATPVAQTPAPERDEWESMIYTNPAKAKEALKNEIRQEFQQKEVQKQNEKKFWEDFYEENSDLKPLESTVNLILKDKWAEVEKLPIDQAKQILAKATRKHVSQIRAAAGITETTLPSGGAVTLGSSGVPAPRAPQAQPPAPKSMTDQLFEFRRKRSTK